eukprot:NODE_1425_length_961_cov_25.053728_g1101_i0.p1 GENE.NODE_1425_length_961_cov_25.053728_g1101_i0~~NODE_1425_length_961_cov_25.053728_g1101_i0.p1  ORF type:complete len:217 (-),score=51.99 NODE_1425_length_961_cov_25.053728_g1101_i0:209-859(-)
MSSDQKWGNMSGPQKWEKYSNASEDERIFIWDGLNQDEKNELLQLVEMMQPSTPHPDEPPKKRRAEETPPDNWDQIVAHFQSQLLGVLRGHSGTIAAAHRTHQEMFLNQLKRQESQVVDQYQHQENEIKKLLDSHSAAQKCIIQEEYHKKLLIPPHASPTPLPPDPNPANNPVMLPPRLLSVVTGVHIPHACLPTDLPIHEWGGGVGQPNWTYGRM